VNPFGNGPADPHAHKKIPGWAKGLAKYAAEKKAAIAKGKVTEVEKAKVNGTRVEVNGTRAELNGTKTHHQKGQRAGTLSAPPQEETPESIQKKALKAYTDDLVHDGNGQEGGVPTPGYGSMKVKFSHAHPDHIRNVAESARHHTSVILLGLVFSVLSRP